MRGKKPLKYEVPSWDYIHELCVRVADQIERSGYKPELLVAIARGGWIPGRVLSDLLENSNVATIQIEYYLDIYKTRRKPKITQKLPIDIKGKKVLLIDDIADSGKSLKLAKEYLMGQGAADVKICTLYHKPWSIVMPDFCARETDVWVCFPHEVYETMKKIVSKLKVEGKSRGDIEKELVRIGMKPLIVKRLTPRIFRQNG